MTLTFPQGPWPPNPQRLTTTAQTLLAAASGALAQNQITDYDRQVITHGIRPVIAPQEAAQLIVNCEGIFLGKAGAQQYQFQEGAFGKYAFYFARFGVTVARKGVTITGGLAPTLPTPAAQGDAAAPLWRDAWIVWSAMLALSLGGITPPAGPLVPPADSVMVGPMVASDSQGVQSWWQITVEVQM